MMNDKDFFKEMKKEGSEYSENITESFPYFSPRRSHE